MTRGEIQVFMSSLRLVSNELSKVEAKIPERVFAELKAMENFLQHDLDLNSRVNKP